MYKRELKRNGKYKLSPSQELYTVAVVLLIFGAFGVISFSEISTNGLRAISNYFANLSFATLILPFLIYIALKVSLTIKWCLYGIYALIGAYLIADSFKEVPNYEHIRTILYLLFISFEGGIILVYVWITVIYPKIVLYCSRDYPGEFWKVQLDHGKEGHYKCKRVRTVLGFNPFERQRSFSYAGPINEDGEPHGFGKWKSEWATGEVLTGYFDRGFPIGPFKSREYRTGYSFSNVRIAFASYTTGGFDTYTFKSGPARWGVAAVECSMSGYCRLTQKILG
jgi:hypothetical protein